MGNADWKEPDFLGRLPPPEKPPVCLWDPLLLPGSSDMFVYSFFGDSTIFTATSSTIGGSTIALFVFNFFILLLIQH